MQLDNRSTNVQISITLQGTVRELQDLNILKQVKISMLTWRGGFSQSQLQLSSLVIG